MKKEHLINTCEMLSRKFPHPDYISIREDLDNCFPLLDENDLNDIFGGKSTFSEEDFCSIVTAESWLFCLHPNQMFRLIPDLYTWLIRIISNPPLESQDSLENFGKYAQHLEWMISQTLTSIDPQEMKKIVSRDDLLTFSQLAMDTSIYASEQGFKMYSPPALTINWDPFNDALDMLFT